MVQTWPIKLIPMIVISSQSAFSPRTPDIKSTSSSSLLRAWDFLLFSKCFLETWETSECENPSSSAADEIFTPTRLEQTIKVPLSLVLTVNFVLQVAFRMSIGTESVPSDWLCITVFVLHNTQTVSSHSSLHSGQRQQKLQDKWGKHEESLTPLQIFSRDGGGAVMWEAAWSCSTDDK